MLSLGVLASCSNDEPAPSTGEQGGETRYMAVRIQSVPDLGSRAGDQSNEGDATFETGEGNESEIAAADLRFFFFDAAGNAYPVSEILYNGNTAAEGSNMVTPTDVEPTETNGKPDGSKKGILVLHIPEGKVATTPPAKVVCVANIDWATEAVNYENKKLSELEALTHSFPEDGITMDSKFAMTSSTYKETTDGNTVVNYTDITGKLKTEIADAENDPANIYLERLAVKIRPNAVNFTQEYKVMRSENGQLTEEEFEFNNNGTVTKLSVELDGWKPYNTVDKAYSLKSIDATWNTSTPFTGWNNADLHRCYWAQIPVNVNFENTEYSLADDEDFTTGNWYTYENTNLQSNTKMIVRGTVYATDDASKTPIDFVKWGGYFYTTEAFKTLVANDQNVDANTVTLIADATKANTYKVQVNGTDVPKYTGIYWWQNGVTSYVVDLKHLDTNESTAIVRNHIYDYTFNNVIGLGIPGNIPTPTEQTDTYLAAKIYVLNWRLVSKTITLE